MKYSRNFVVMQNNRAGTGGGYSVGNQNPALVLDFANGVYRTDGATAQNFSDVVDFSRTGLATVTDSDGVIKWAPHNLLTYSEQFDNAAWTKTGVSVSSDGAEFLGNSVQKLTEDSSTGFHRLLGAFTFSAVQYTLSFFVQAAGRSEVRVFVFDGGANRGVYFDLSSGEIGTETGGTGTITPLGGGIFRCAMTFTANAGSGNAQIILSEGSETTSYTGDGTSGIYVWGAHLYRSDLGGMQDVPNEERKVSATYLPTTSAARYLPRFDYDVTGGDLIDRATTNLATYSEAFDNAAWSKTNLTVTANAAVAPDDTTTADSLVPTAVGGGHFTTAANASFVSGTTYTMSVYAKANGYNFLRLSFSGGVAGASAREATYNLATGAVDSVDSSIAIIQSSGNGWYRCTLTTDATATASAYACGITVNETSQSGGDLDNYTGDGTSGIYAWGAQLEEGSTPTSYLKTEGTAVSRDAVYASPTITAAGLLVEESRTNDIADSEDMAASGTLQFASLGDDDVGERFTLQRLVPDTSTNLHQYRQIPTNASSEHTFSVIAKSDGYDVALSAQNPGEGTYRVYFNLTDGTTTETSTSAATQSHGIQYLGDGYYRCWITYSFVQTDAYYLDISAGSDGNISFTGDGTSAVLVSYRQEEEGSFPTSYIPTTGSAATRAVGEVEEPTASYASATEGTLVIEATVYDTGNVQHLYSFNDGANNRIQIAINAAGQPAFAVVSGGVTEVAGNFLTAITFGEKFKISLTYGSGRVAASVNGGAADESAGITLPASYSEWRLGRSHNDVQHMTGHIEKALYFPVEFTDEQLQDASS